MRSFIKKDLLLFWRDRKELITVLVLPIILVVVLNFAFAGLFNNEKETNLHLQLAVVNQDDEAQAMGQLKEKLTQEASLGEEEALKIVEQASLVRPVPILSTYLSS